MRAIEEYVETAEGRWRVTGRGHDGTLEGEPLVSSELATVTQGELSEGEMGWVRPDSEPSDGKPLLGRELSASEVRRRRLNR